MERCLICGGEIPEKKVLLGTSGYCYCTWIILPSCGCYVNIENLQKHECDKKGKTMTSSSNDQQILQYMKNRVREEQMGQREPNWPERQIQLQERWLEKLDRAVLFSEIEEVCQGLGYDPDQSYRMIFEYHLSK